MKKVLVVSPNFPPSNTPDSQRIRMSLPYYKEFGWEPTILCVDPNNAGGAYDKLLNRTVPRGIRVVTAQIASEAKCRRFGFGHLWLRSLFPLWRAGRILLEDEKFDVIYFSTTLFGILPLGRWWKKRFNVPLVVDIQDPWYTGAKRVYNVKTAPGGALKYSVSRLLSRFMECYTFPVVNQFISVSPGYVRAILARYPSLRDDQFTVIPFGGPDHDFEVLSELDLKQTIFDPSDGLRHFVYIGRGGPDLNPVLLAFFRGIRRIRSARPEILQDCRFHFVGTNYSPVDRTFDVVRPLAVNEGVGDLVDEQSVRIPYLEALKTMQESDGILLFGSTSADYTASKLFPCLMCRRPVLAIFHERSLVSALLKDIYSTSLVTFDSEEDLTNHDEQIATQIVRLCATTESSSDDFSNFAQYSARSLTREQCEVFKRSAENALPK